MSNEFNELLALVEELNEAERKLRPLRELLQRRIDECFSMPQRAREMPTAEYAEIVRNCTTILSRCKVGQYWHCAPSQFRYRNQ